MDPKQQAAAQPETSPSGVEDYDEFADVFASLTDKPEDTPNDQEGTEGAQDAAAAGAAQDDDQSGQSGDGQGSDGQPAATGDDTAAADGAGQPAAGEQHAAGGDAQPAGQPVDWEARFRELEARITAQPAPAAAEPAATPAPAPVEEPPIFTAEEQAELTELQTAWPEVHRLFSLMSRQLQVDTLKYAFSEVDKVVSPLQQTLGTYVQDDHMAAIYDAHSDYDQVYQPVMDWIEQQPSFLKAAYQNVVKQGTAADVAEMITRFKQETQWQTPAATPPAQAGATPPASAPAVQQPAELSGAAKQAAKAMGAVGTKRGGMQTAVDPNDFDGAWADALSGR